MISCIVLLSSDVVSGNEIKAMEEGFKKHFHLIGYKTNRNKRNIPRKCHERTNKLDRLGIRVLAVRAVIIYARHTLYTCDELRLIRLG